MAPPTPTTTPMTVLRVLDDIPDVSAASPVLSPGVDVVTFCVVSTSWEPSVLVRVTTRMAVETTGVGVGLGVFSPWLDEAGGGVDEVR